MSKDQRPYAIKFTSLAEVVANRHGGVEALEEQIRKELLPPWGPSKINKLFFHVVSMNGSHFDEKAPKFLCKPSGKDVLMVDAIGGYVDSGETIKGKIISYVPEAFDE